MSRLEVLLAVTLLVSSPILAEPGIEHYLRQFSGQLQLESPDAAFLALNERDFSTVPPLPSILTWPNLIDGGLPPIPSAKRDELANWSLVGGAALLTGSILLFIDYNRNNRTRI